MSIIKFLDPKNDFAFKQVFGTEKNKDIFIHFLNDVLDKNNRGTIIDIEFLKPSPDPEVVSKKQSVVDVLCKDSSGIQYIVEMQVAHLPASKNVHNTMPLRSIVAKWEKEKTTKI